MMRPVLTLALLVPLMACRPQADTSAPDSASEPSVLPDASELAAIADSPEAIFAASDLPEPLAAPMPEDAMKASIHRLSNGMSVYISTDREQPRFNAWIAVRSGSRNDPSASTGLAHYLEHMLFKGTDDLGTLDFAAEKPHIEKIAELYGELRGDIDSERRKAIFAEIDRLTLETAKTAIPNEFDNLYRAMGVKGLNAFTSDDQTVYIADVPSNRIEAWARVEAERFTDAQFRLFYPELEAVYEEKNRSLDNPDRRTWQAMREALFPGHPYGTQPTIGTVEHLKTPAYADMQAYFDQWYQPNNIAIILAGDVDAATVLPILEKNFGAWQPKRLLPAEKADMVGPSGRALTQVSAPGEQSVTVAWRTVPADHADLPALKVMDMLVDNASTGLLNVNLILSQKLPEGGSYLYSQAEAGQWTIQGTAREGQSLEEVEGLLDAVVADLKAGRFRQEDLDAVILNAEIQLKRRQEANAGRVRAMADAYINRIDWRDYAKSLEAMRKVTRQDVLRVAQSYLGEDRAVVHRVRGSHEPPKIEKPKITPIPIDPSRHSKFYEDVLAMPATQLEPRWLEEGRDYQRSELATGELLAVANERNDLFTLRYAFDVGSRARPLLCHAIELAEQSGTEELDAANFRRRLHALGTTLKMGCDADASLIEISGIDRNLEASVDLIDNWVRKVSPTRETVHGLRDNTLSKRRDAMDHPRTLAAALDAYASHGRNSRFLRVASNRQIAKASGRKLAKEFAALAKTRHRTEYFGPRKADALTQVVALGTGAVPLKQRPARSFRRVKSPTIFLLDKKTAQAQIRVLYPNKAISREQRAALRALNGYLGGGMGGLIFQEMREARGLAYTAFARYDAGILPKDDAGVRGYIGTQVDKTPEALQTMLALLAAPVQPDRLQGALRAIEEEYRTARIRTRDIAQTVAIWDDRGEKSDPRPAEREGLAELTPAQLDELAKAMTDMPVVISIVADKERLDLNALAKLGKVKELKVKQLFGY